ncbi:hypothetical protein H744_1c0229 [Photobacterium gaetbulicola Gung47]|uniref:Glyoxalase/bleomycin resistance protein/dioxygenase n=1 Tax=Photobacterium gaetbulicola Gung47 TaxID=658445 RepID=A0A0C5WQQ6_9GAMM|nr:hypothetical protein H744_1c0229 [Photobacterium gaetbulicola Gung47]
MEIVHARLETHQVNVAWRTFLKRPVASLALLLEDPFGNLFELYSHSYEDTYASDYEQ